MDGVAAGAAAVGAVELQPEASFAERRARALLRFARQQPISAAGGIVVLILIAAAVLAPVAAPHSPTRTSVDVLVGAGGKHWFGTDNLGRDIAARTLYGARTSLAVGLVSVAASTVIGTLLGLVSGYVGGVWDLLIQRLIDSVLAIPPLILALAAVTVLGPSIRNVMGVIAFLFVPTTARVVRGSVLSSRHDLYVEAARVVGCTNRRVLLRHILPNVTAPIIVLCTVGLGASILLEASLSFLGAGTPPPAASWGRDLSDTRSLWTSAPHVFWPPAVTITLAVFGFNLLGDGLRDALDPRLRRR